MSDRIKKPSEGEASDKAEASDNTNRTRQQLSNEKIAIIKAESDAAAQEATNERKSMRIKVARETIRWSLSGLTVWGAIIVTILMGNTVYFKMDLTNEIYFLTLVISGVLNIITLTLGFVAGSSID